MLHPSLKQDHKIEPFRDKKYKNILGHHEWSASPQGVYKDKNMLVSSLKEPRGSQWANIMYDDLNYTFYIISKLI